MSKRHPCKGGCRFGHRLCLGQRSPHLCDDPRYDAVLRARDLAAPPRSRDAHPSPSELATLSMQGPSAVPKYRRPDGPPSGFAQVWPAAFVGGAERAMIAVIRATREAIEWRGVGLMASSGNAPEVVEELRKLGPVALGPESCRELCSASKVVVSWGVPQAGDMLDPGAKHVAVSHSPSGSPWALRAISETRRVDRWVGVSEAALGPLTPSQRKGAVVIPNPVDYARLKPTRTREAVRSEWGATAKTKIAGMLGRLSSEKDPWALVRAVSHLPPEWIGVSVGDGHEGENFRRYVGDLGGGRVVVEGARKDAGNVLRAFDVLLVPSHYESFCLTIAEGWALGVPVVATGVGLAAENPSFVEPVAMSDPGPGLARAILAAHARGGSKEARSLVRERYHPSVVGPAWAEFLRGVHGPGARVAPGGG